MDSHPSDIKIKDGGRINQKVRRYNHECLLGFYTGNDN